MSAIERRCDVSVDGPSMGLHVTKIDEVGVTRPSEISLHASLVVIVVGPIAPGLLRSNLSIQKLKMKIKLAKSWSKSAAVACNSD